MADDAVSPPANAGSPAPQGNGAATSAPSPSAAPAAAVTPSAPSAPAAKAETPGSPAGLTKQDVRSGLMDAAKAALTKTRSGQPSAQSPKGKGAAVAAPPADAAGKAAPPEKTESPQDGAASASDASASGPTDGAVDPNAPADEDDETKPPPFNEHPRWKKLTRDHEVAVTRIKELEPHADQYRKILQYMDTMELDHEDVATAYDITAKLKHNPQLAYQALKPIWDELCARVGVTLPEDLAKRVKEGFLDEASARELAQQRSATATARQTVTRFSEQQTREQAQTMQRNVQSTVAKWATQQTAKNPDFSRLQPFVEDAARSIMHREGAAKTPDQAIAVLDRALKEVTDRLQPFRPAPTNGSTPRQPAAGSPSTAVAPPEPSSLREAMQLGLEGRYRAGQR